MSDGVGQIFNDPTLSSLKLTLQASSARQVALASNIVNSNTPGYKRVDLTTSFQNDLNSALKNLDQGSPLSATPKAAFDTADLQNPARYDGNTVNLDQEVTEMMKNSANYSFSAKLLALKYSALKDAITGKTS
ncbi:flagellar basal-body rod protein FlgB [Verrucomicrobium sp. GAS474]|uniref:flagellar basal body rod protein FlgB n=1 Tax=Verrucomicrobium sp. GAS474 TaxID=1882831 RepID=UPI00087B5ABF|nr:flagellar basal body rod protein FlgB [Verrucomicrobium sp. GAS474]SDU25187.1 flagellar basal-body rod protein FlgB [Verrucomicrobium sp. GAS474]